jgi:hypothetical protein
MILSFHFDVLAKGMFLRVYTASQPRRKISSSQFDTHLLYN